MGRKSVVCGIVAVWMGVGATAFAQVASAPPTRLNPEQPRYATMIPTAQDDAMIDGQARTPAAAPTPKVDTVQAAEPQAAAPQTAAPAPSAVAQAAPVGAPSADDAVPAVPRYAAPAPPLETVEVTALRQSEDNGYRLGTGDKVRVTVFNETDLSGDFDIDGQGFVRLPLVGQVAAAGQTTSGLENRVAAALIQGGYLISPRISVEVRTYRPFYILGEVAKPGEYPYVNAMTAPNAVALAGGFTERAVESRIYIRHQGESREYSYRADETTRIRPGDVVRVERSTYWSLMTALMPIFSPFATAAYLLK